MKDITKIAAVVGALAVLLGTAWKLDCRWVQAEAFAEFKQQYAVDRMEDNLDRTNDRLWDVEERLKYEPNNRELQRQKAELTERKKRLENKITTYEKGGR